MTQQQRIDKELDSQMKRVLQKSIEHIETCKQFHKMMATLEGIYSDPANRTIESVEEFIEASKHSVSIGGPKYHSWQLEEWVEEIMINKSNQ